MAHPLNPSGNCDSGDSGHSGHSGRPAGPAVQAGLTAAGEPERLLIRKNFAALSPSELITIASSQAHDENDFRRVPTTWVQALELIQQGHGRKDEHHHHFDLMIKAIDPSRGGLQRLNVFSQLDRPKRQFSPALGLR